MSIWEQWAKIMGAAVGSSVVLAGCATSAAPSTAELALVSPPQVPPPITRAAGQVRVSLEATEWRGRLADGVEYDFWGFNGSVPGPLVRIREGDTVDLHLKNRANSLFPHSIDLHAVTGPGGGGAVTQTPPGGETAFQFKALNPGLYVYHCATPVIPHHIASGMYGLILVEPAGGLPPVDKEFYLMQGEFYTQGALNQKGLQPFSFEKLLAETPEYVVFNGATDSLVGERALKARVGDRVRLFFGVGGPNKTSSFHLIGEIWDRAYLEASTQWVPNVQTTMVPAGGATIVEFKLDAPGTYILVDHSLSRLLRGAAGLLVAEGPDQPEVFKSLQPGAGSGGH